MCVLCAAEALFFFYLFNLNPFSHLLSCKWMVGFAILLQFVAGVMLPCVSLLWGIFWKRNMPHRDRHRGSLDHIPVGSKAQSKPRPSVSCLSPTASFQDGCARRCCLQSCLRRGFRRSYQWSVFYVWHWRLKATPTSLFKKLTDERDVLACLPTSLEQTPASTLRLAGVFLKASLANTSSSVSSFGKIRFEVADSPYLAVLLVLEGSSFTCFLGVLGDAIFCLIMWISQNNHYRIQPTPSAAILEWSQAGNRVKPEKDMSHVWACWGRGRNSFSTECKPS